MESRTCVFRYLCSSAGRIKNLHRFVKLAFIGNPLVGNSSLDGLPTLEARTRVEQLTVAAGMKRRLAFGAGCFLSDDDLRMRHLVATSPATDDNRHFSIDGMSKRTHLVAIA